jgi:hypothetical protein
MPPPITFYAPYANFLLKEEWRLMVIWLGSRLRAIVTHLNHEEMESVTQDTYLQYVESLRTELVRCFSLLEISITNEQLV